ncbi:hypothetical protein ACTMU2_00505 [Cupriavidus basilensis]
MSRPRQRPSPVILGAAWLVRALGTWRGGGLSELRRALQTRIDVGDFTLEFTQGQRGLALRQLAASAAR